jgi:hypothetical protein
MSQDQSAGPVVHSFFADHLITVKALRPASSTATPRSPSQASQPCRSPA